MKKLPIGLQDFTDFSKRNCVYVDKTMYIHKMLDAGGKTFFLSRPRRFGKSLLLSTIRAIFEGQKELFEGLYIYDKIDWKEQHPVVLLDMSGSGRSLDTFKHSLVATLKGIASNYGININYEDPVTIFIELLRLLHQQTGKQVVLLIDEYDKPILDVIEDLEMANCMRSFLQGFYTIIKSSSEHLHFVLLTGVSKISQTSIFSGLNNLNDITLDDKYAAICGYTQQELETGFSEYIITLAKRYEIPYTEMLAKIKHWYNGYSWDGQTFVYNPFSALLLFDKNLFEAHWFNTGSPGFLIKLLKGKDDFSPVLKNEIKVENGFIDSQSLEKLSLVPLCFQTGYLTIKKHDFKTGTYWLQIPNEEVREAFTKAVLANYTGHNNYEINILSKNIKESFAKGDIAQAIENIRTLFSQISYNTHLPSEYHYHAMFQLVMNLSGIDQRSESYTNKGRTDSVLRFSKRIYIIEIKYASSNELLDSSLEEALDQIKRMRYYEPFLNQGLDVHLIALAFTKGEMSYKQEMI